MQEADMRECCRHLRARAPEEWQQFVDMFGAYTAEVVEAVSDADAGDIMTQKGRALNCRALLRMMTSLDMPPAPVGPPLP